MHIQLLAAPFQPYLEIARYQDEHLLKGQYGACAHFVGTMRDYNDGAKVYSMFLEHYPGMTEQQLQQIAEIAQAKWALLDVLILHRVGRVAPGDPIMLAATWSAHRKAAFAACLFIVEELKSTAPFWKQEQTTQGGRWVSQNTPG